MQAVHSEAQAAPRSRVCACAIESAGVACSAQSLLCATWILNPAFSRAHGKIRHPVLTTLASSRLRLLNSALETPVVTRKGCSLEVTIRVDLSLVVRELNSAMQYLNEQNTRRTLVRSPLKETASPYKSAQNIPEAATGVLKPASAFPSKASALPIPRPKTKKRSRSSGGASGGGFSASWMPDGPGESNDDDIFTLTDFRIPDKQAAAGAQQASSAALAADSHQQHVSDCAELPRGCALYTAAHVQASARVLDTLRSIRAGPAVTGMQQQPSSETELLERSAADMWHKATAYWTNPASALPETALQHKGRALERFSKVSGA